jgi:hypothetical protein
MSTGPCMPPARRSDRRSVSGGVAAEVGVADTELGQPRRTLIANRENHLDLGPDKVYVAHSARAEQSDKGVSRKNIARAQRHGRILPSARLPHCIYRTSIANTQVSKRYSVDRCRLSPVRVPVCASSILAVKMAIAAGAAATPSAQPYFRPTLIAALAAIAGVIIGSIAPWAGVMVFNMGGLDFGNWGVATLILGAISAMALPTEFFWIRTSLSPRSAVPVVWTAALAGVACLTDAVMNIVRLMTIPKGNFFGVPIGPGVGWGLWLVAFSSAVLTVTASIVAVQTSESTDSSPEGSRSAWSSGWHGPRSSRQC